MPCTGRVDILHLLKAFEAGWDTVFVSGCHEGDCHYLAGNLRARARVGRVAAVLDKIGMGGERVAMYNLSAGEGNKFARFATEMVEKIRSLGPSPVNVARQARKQASS